MYLVDTNVISEARNVDDFHGTGVGPKNPFILKIAVSTPLVLRYALLCKALSTNGVVHSVIGRSL